MGISAAAGGLSHGARTAVSVGTETLAALTPVMQAEGVSELGKVEAEAEGNDGDTELVVDGEVEEDAEHGTEAPGPSVAKLVRNFEAMAEGSPKEQIHETEQSRHNGGVAPHEEVRDVGAATIEKVQTIFHNFTLMKFEKVFALVLALEFSSFSVLTCIAFEIFEKALREPTFSGTYAELCSGLNAHCNASGLKYVDVGSGKQVTFLHCLLYLCENALKNSLTVTGEDTEMGEDLSPLNPLAADATGKEKGEKANDVFGTAEAKLLATKKRLLGNVQFIDELYKADLIRDTIVHANCIQPLLVLARKKKEPQVLEALCLLLSSTGTKLAENTHTDTIQAIEIYFGHINKLATEKSIEPRVRFMLKDLIEQRQNGWKQRSGILGCISIPPEIQAGVGKETCQMGNKTIPAGVRALVRSAHGRRNGQKSPGTPYDWDSNDSPFNGNAAVTTRPEAGDPSAAFREDKRTEVNEEVPRTAESDAGMATVAVVASGTASAATAVPTAVANAGSFDCHIALTAAPVSGAVDAATNEATAACAVPAPVAQSKDAVGLGQIDAAVEGKGGDAGVVVVEQMQEEMQAEVQEEVNDDSPSASDAGEASESLPSIRNIRASVVPGEVVTGAVPVPVAQSKDAIGLGQMEAAAEGKGRDAGVVVEEAIQEEVQDDAQEEVDDDAGEAIIASEPLPSARPIRASDVPAEVTMVDGTAAGPSDAWRLGRFGRLLIGGIIIVGPIVGVLTRALISATSEKNNK